MTNLIHLFDVFERAFRNVAIGLFAALFLFNTMCSIIFFAYIALQNPETALYTNSLVVMRAISIFLMSMVLSIIFSLTFYLIKTVLINKYSNDIIKKLKC